MPCQVCGAALTVKAHLFPRALFHGMRGNHPKLYAGSAAREGIQWPQSGYFDPSLLCDAHERALGPFDDYAVDFVRKFPGSRVRCLDQRWLVSGVNCDQLLLFGLSVLWRYSASRIQHADAVDIGRHEARVSSAVFQGGDLSDFGLWIDAWVNDPPDYCDVFMAPYGDNDGGLWRFAASGLRFQITMPGYRNRHVAPTSTRLNRRRAATGYFVNLEASEEWNGMVEIGAQMLRGERKLAGRAERIQLNR